MVTEYTGELVIFIFFKFVPYNASFVSYDMTIDSVTKRRFEWIVIAYYVPFETQILFVAILTNKLQTSWCIQRRVLLLFSESTNSLEEVNENLYRVKEIDQLTSQILQLNIFAVRGKRQGRKVTEREEERDDTNWKERNWARKQCTLNNIELGYASWTIAQMNIAVISTLLKHFRTGIMLLSVLLRHQSLRFFIL